jgi:aspartyl-tRNA synthetase
LDVELCNFTFLKDMKHIHYILAKGLGKVGNKKLDLLFGNEPHVKMIKNQIIPSIAVEKDDVLFLGFGNKRENVLNSLGRIRSRLGHHENPQLTGWDFLWVVDFPLFEENDGVISSTHHPFTSPHEDDLERLYTDPLSVRGLHYDIVLNGCEIGGGSIRIHDPTVQEKVLTILKSNKEQFAHLFEAFSYGCPPHGGLALGLDRLMSLICKTKSIRDVIAFPKSMNGNEMMTGSPSEVSQEQLDELFLTLK